MIKVDLHMHSGEDPYDGLRYTAVQLIDRAVELGFAAIAVTLHEKVIEDERVFDYARQKGLLFIRAVEWNIQGRDVLLYNLTQREASRLQSFDDLRAYKRERGDDLLVVAPHPCYPRGHSLGRAFERYIFERRNRRDIVDSANFIQHCERGPVFLVCKCPHPASNARCPLSRCLLRLARLYFCLANLCDRFQFPVVPAHAGSTKRFLILRISRKHARPMELGLIVELIAATPPCERELTLRRFAQ